MAVLQPQGGHFACQKNLKINKNDGKTSDLPSYLVKDSFIERPALQRLPDFCFRLLHGVARSKSAGRALKPLRMDDHVVQ